MRKHLLRNALLAAGALALVAGSANAQDYDDYNGAHAGPDEGVNITAPHYNYGKTENGAPVVRVFLSRQVRFDDLDLTTYRGARALRDRVRLTARLLCRDLDQRWPVTADNGGDRITCYHDAADNALYRADRAIRDARSYYD